MAATYAAYYGPAISSQSIVHHDEHYAAPLSQFAAPALIAAPLVHAAPLAHYQAPIAHYDESHEEYVSNFTNVSNNM